MKKMYILFIIKVVGKTNLKMHQRQSRHMLLNKMLKKLGEENTEIIIAAKNPAENEIIYEIADYLYHLEVIMAEKGVDWDDITRELIRRQKNE